MFFQIEGLKLQKPVKWSQRPLKALVHANSCTLVTHNGLPETECCSRHYLSKSCFSTSRPFLFFSRLCLLHTFTLFCCVFPRFIFPRHFNQRSSVFCVRNFNETWEIHQEERSCEWCGRLRMVVWELGRILGVKCSRRWNATKKTEKQTNIKHGVKDWRMTSQHPKVLQAQPTWSLCLDDGFVAIVASSLVNEVIAVSTVTLYLESSMDI